MSNATRRVDKGLGKTAAGGSGGSFASHQRTASTAPLVAGSPKTQEVTVPARQIQLTIGEPPSLPEELNLADAGFGVDDSGRFFSSWRIEGKSGPPRNLIYTDFEGGSEALSDPEDGSEDIDGMQECLEQAHALLRTNSYRAGRAACEENKTLERQIIDVSLGHDRVGSSHHQHQHVIEMAAERGYTGLDDETIDSYASQNFLLKSNLERLERAFASGDVEAARRSMDLVYRQVAVPERIRKAGIERPIDWNQMSGSARDMWEDMQLERLDRSPA